MMRGLCISLAAVMLCCITPFSANAATLSTPNILEDKVTASAEADAERVAVLVNNFRRQNGVPELQMLPRLNKIADIRAQEISQKFDHTRPDGTGIRELIEQYKIDWRKIGENLAMGQPTPDSAVESWKNSPNHRANMLNPDYQYIGVSCYYANGTYHWVQIFLRPASTVNVGAYYPRNYGDVNDDGMIDGVDATTVLTDYAMRSVGKASLFDEVHMQIADMSRDGVVNGIDATNIFTYYVRSSVNK